MKKKFIKCEWCKPPTKFKTRECYNCGSVHSAAFWRRKHRAYLKREGILDDARSCVCGHHFHAHVSLNCKHEVGCVCAINKCASACKVTGCRCNTFREKGR